MDESMIARQDAYIEKTDVWAKLAAPVPSGVISWRQDGKVTARDGKYFARFVAYVEANTVRERLDSVVPGEWDLTLELLPAISTEDGDGAQCSFKARLQILGVIREDVGTGRDYKQASTDAFKRAAVRFGIAHELYAYEQNWVEMDGDGKFAKPVDDPQQAYQRRYGKPGAAVVAEVPANGNGHREGASAPSLLTDMELVSCPKCGGRMWDNRLTKRNPKAPDYKCQNRSCDGVIWPPKPTATAPNAEAQDERKPVASVALGATEDELPF
jgi:hypothetical protein